MATRRLERIDGSFLNTSLVATGAVLDVPGADGRRVSLNVTIDRGRLEDVLRLAVNTPKPPLVGALRLHTRFEIPPGDRDVVEKLLLNGRFTIVHGRFASDEIQQKIAELSHRARGKKADVPQERVASDFAGRFALGHGVLKLPTVTFNVPGADVRLSGQYALRQETLDFHGNLLIDAKVSQTVGGFKSVLLRAADPFFRRDGRTVILIGSRSPGRVKILRSVWRRVGCSGTTTNGARGRAATCGRPGNRDRLGPPASRISANGPSA